MDMSEITLCGASYYEQKYYFNPQFSGLPQGVRQELQILCVTYTEKVGGVFTMFFDENGSLKFQVQSQEGDGRFDEIGSGLEIKKIQMEKAELLESLEMYYRIFILKEENPELT